MSRAERGLFQDHIGILDAKIQPGLTKLMWSFMGTAKDFVQDCILHVDKVGARRSPSDGKRPVGQTPISVCGIALMSLSTSFPLLPKFQVLVSKYKSINLSISSLCQKMSETLLIALDGKTIYR